MKLIITGHKHHGKDTACKILNQSMGYSYAVSSWTACINFIFDALKYKYCYKTQMECFNDRINRRAEWYELIRQFNTPDKARLGKMIFSDKDIYNGIRDLEELNALRDAGVFDFLIWIDRSEHCPPEDLDSMNITREHADYVVNNNVSGMEVFKGELEKMLAWCEAERVKQRMRGDKWSAQEIVDMLKNNEVNDRDVITSKIYNALGVPATAANSEAVKEIAHSFKVVNAIHERISDREAFHQSSIEHKFMSLFDRITALENKDKKPEPSGNFINT